MTPAEPPRSTDTQTTLHASCVAHAGRAVLILGPSGSGKSALALQLIALGAQLVADDRTVIHRDGAALLASAPTRLSGLIEARELGILRSPACDTPQPVALVIDMDQTETDRLPPHRETDLLGLTRPLLRKSTLPHFPAAIVTYLSGGRAA
jgi:HPr kinase/phosphorylase